MPRMYTNPHCQFTSKSSFIIFCYNHPHLLAKMLLVARFESLIFYVLILIRMEDPKTQDRTPQTEPLVTT